MEKQFGDTHGEPASVNDATDTEKRHVGYHRRIFFVAGCFAVLSTIPGLITTAIVASETGPTGQIRKMIMGLLIFAAEGFVLGVTIMCMVAPRAFMTGPVGRPWMELIGTKSVLGARIACLALGLVMTLILVGVFIGFLNKMGN